LNLPRLLVRLLLGRRLPRTQGALAVPGLHGRVRIHRDRWGIPHIEADHELDAHFGLGFCHGQDRTFQLEMLQRVVRGTLAELLGGLALPIDCLSRRIGFHHTAAAQWHVLDADIQAMMEAYARGAAAGVSQGLSRRPHEFVLLRAQPSPWTALDSVGLIKLMSFNLPSNWDIELARLKVLLEDGQEALAALDSSYDPCHPVTSPPDQKAGSAVDYLARDLAAFAKFLRPGGASNNWSIAASRTRTGRPLLANDPHMSANLPSHWYLAHLRTPDWATAGASFVGGPGIFSGHNGCCAWGITAGLTDNTDLFQEQIGPDGASVKEGDRWTPCPVREEVIRIKGANPVTERVLVTPRGPIISPALPVVKDGQPSFALSMRAVWLDPLPFQGLFLAHRARTWDEFRRYMSQWPALPQNVAYADATGTIGWQLIGTAPRRKRGYGAFPLPGWEPDVGWHAEHLPFEQLPYLVNPAQGFVATANTMPLPYGVEPFLSVDWIDGYRLERINQVVGSRSDWDVPATQQLQGDQLSLAWSEMRSTVLDLPADNAETRLALGLLQAWDGRVSIDSPAATVYELFVAEMANRLARIKAPRTYRLILGETVSVLTPYNFYTFRRTNHLSRLLRGQPAGWFPHGWPTELTAALAAVIVRLKQEFGADPGRWGWGRLRPLVMTHPLGRRGWLARVFNLGPVPCGGDTDTVNQASAMPLRPLAPTENIASLRVAIDVGDWGQSRFVLPAGQSGNPLSPHYGDLFALWQRGEGVPIAWTAEEVLQATVDTLELTPG
jgi:penicillin G amidase